MAPNLPTLPVELMSSIVEQIEEKDLLDLRLTCREVSSAVDGVFTNAFFRERAHLYTTAGLQTLVDITSLPRLVAKIKQVDFMIFDPRATDTWTDEHDRKLIDAHCRQEQRARTEKGRSLLAHVFKNFENAGLGDVQIAVYDCSDWARWRWDRTRHNTLLHDLAPEVRKDYRDGVTCRQLVSFLFSELAKTNLHIRVLDLCHRASSSDFKLDFLTQVAKDQWAKLLPKFQEIRVLKVGFADGQDENKEGEACFAQIVTQLRRLEELSIRGNYTDQDQPDRIYRRFDHLPVKGLQKLDIDGTNVTSRHLVEFITAHSGTLTSLDLRYLTLPLGECWKAVLRTIINEATQLQRLSLEELGRETRDGVEDFAVLWDRRARKWALWEGERQTLLAGLETMKDTWTYVSPWDI